MKKKKAFQTKFDFWGETAISSAAYSLFVFMKNLCMMYISDFSIIVIKYYLCACMSSIPFFKIMSQAFIEEVFGYHLTTFGLI